VQEAEAIPDDAEREKAFKNAMRQEADRKLKEMKLAIGVEKKNSKDEILLGYLNIALFGRQIYGIESAAQYYYGKPAAQLTLAESASLVAIVNNPSILQIDLADNIEANTERRNKILESMLRTGHHSQDLRLHDSHPRSRPLLQLRADRNQERPEVWQHPRRAYVQLLSWRFQYRDHG
jgi:membrane peptidoglycan carboxypeptidase